MCTVTVSRNGMYNTIAIYVKVRHNTFYFQLLREREIYNHPLTWKHYHNHRVCLHGLESRSERRFGT